MKFFDQLINSAVNSTDSNQLKLQKRFLVILSIFTITGGIVWGIISIYYGMKIPSLVPFGYVLISIINLGGLYLYGYYNIVKIVQTTTSLLFPFLFQISLGGIFPSGAIMIWAILSLLASLTLYKPKTGLLWLLIFIIATVATTIFDKLSNSLKPAVLPELSITFIVINILLVSICIYWLVMYFILRQQRTQEELTIQKIMIEEQHKEIRDSINYAKRIQSAILPSQKSIDQYNLECFCLYMPKDVVAGDFYWMLENDSNILFAAADCTGHGVPGAMVSIVCNGALNSTVKEYGITKPSEILNKTRDLVIETFAKSDTDIKDGMDIALCSLNRKTLELQYAGANNPLYYIRKIKDDITNEEYSNGEYILKEIKADKQPIGAFENKKSFTNQIIQLEKGDMVYSFTDGFADQFGGKKGKKFKYKPFKELLLSVQSLSIEDQKEKINLAFQLWVGDYEQIDDVCIVAIKI